ncbi:Invertase/pectin methylesterase inhibitor domain superfamily [Arabidopsis suecica]|uniref:Invertase/pectin methylesterase inhibitor domain superfamily n=1 Tax=Arabidopsis suecica TaxID=45249 RepID=A0A8T2B6W8_ARASU|nr:Invertase/pectin methylesterase inhibitor domain superfamily [Arabidopsis suecica]
MAYPCVKRNVFSLLLLLVLLSVTPLSSSLSPSDKVTKDLLYYLCTQPNIDSSFCIPWLNSDPTTFTLDVQGLLDLVFQKTQLLGYKSLAAIKGSVRTMPGSTLKIPFETCVKDYESAIKSIEEAQGFVTSKAYALASQGAAKAFVSISVCEAQFEGRADVPDYVVKLNVFFKRMCNIDRVFSNALTS